MQTDLADAYTDDGNLMLIKRIGRNGEESRINEMLNTPEQGEDPRNPCPPVIEIFDDPEDNDISYLVMPLLRSASNPPFRYVKEVIDFVDQTLEVGRGYLELWVPNRTSQGLAFLHRKGVAHRYGMEMFLGNGVITLS